MMLRTLLPLALLAPLALPGEAQLRRRAPEVVIGLTPKGNLEDVLAATGATCTASIGGTNTHLLRASAGSSLRGAMGQLLGHQDVVYAEPGYIVQTPELGECAPIGSGPGPQPCTVAIVDGTPTAQEYTGQSAAQLINVAAAQAYLTGRHPVVAVVDTGLDFNHFLFRGKLHGPGYDYLAGRPYAHELANGLDDDRDGLVDEAYGHGTHIAGTILLINPDARILPMRVLSSEGYGRAFDVAAAIVAAVDGGAEIVNLSLSMTRSSQAVRDALEYAHEEDVAVFSSAGNTGARGVLFPARNEEVVAVASVDAFDVKSSFSAHGKQVEVCAPGEFVYSALPGGRFGWWSGTSMACAVASGAASLALSAVVPQVEIEVDDAVVESSVKIEKQNPGLSEWLGEGRLDALESVLEALLQPSS